MVPISAPGGTAIDIKPKDMGKAPAVLQAQGWKAVSAATTRCHSLAEATQWDVWGASLGFGCGRAWGLVGNDGDFNDAKASHAAITAYTGVVGPDAIVRGVQDPNHHRALVPVRVPVHVGGQVLVFKNRVTGEEGKWEVLGAGRQFVADGPHAGTGTPYVWSPYDIFDLGPQGIPIISLQDHMDGLEAVKDALAGIGWDLVSGTTRVSQQRLLAPGHKDRVVGTVHEVKSLLGLIPNDYAGWNDWVSFAHAIYAASGGAEWGREEWLDWSNQQAQTPGEPEKRWDTLNPDTVRSRGISWLYEQARLRDPGRTAALAFEAEELFDEEIDAAAEMFGVKYSILRWLQREYIYVQAQDMFIRRRTGTPVKRSSIDYTYGGIADINSMRSELGFTTKGKGPQQASTLLREHPDTTFVENVTYWPGVDRITTFRGAKVFNLWTPGARIAYPHVQDLDVITYLKHCGVVFEDPDVVLWIKWCAYVLRFPNRKPGWHWLVISKPGQGKDMMLMALIYAVGKRNQVGITSHDLGDKNNPYLQNRLVHCSESRQAGGSHRVSSHMYNDIKTYLAAPPEEISIRDKYMKTYDIPNLTAWVLFSNNEIPVELEMGDRRLYVVDSRERSRASDAHYAMMDKWLKDENNLNLVTSFLATYPLTEADKAMIEGVAPPSHAKNVLIQANMSPLDQALDEIIQDAREGNGVKMVITIRDLEHLIRQRLPAWKDLSGIGASLRRAGARPVKDDPKFRNRAGSIRTKKGPVRLWVLAEADANGKNYANLPQNKLKNVYENDTYSPYTTDTETNVVKLHGNNTEDEV